MRYVPTLLLLVACAGGSTSSADGEPDFERMKQLDKDFADLEEMARKCNGC